jgi:Mg-chelatase subunit ChlD
MDQHQNDRSSAGPTRPSLSANAPAFYPSSTNNRDMMPPPPRYAAMPPPQQYHRQSNYHHGPPTAFPQRQSRWGPSPRFAPPPFPPPRPVPPQQIQSHQKTQVASYNVEMVKVEVKREQTKTTTVPIKSCFKNSGEKRVSDSSAGAESAKASRNDQSTSLKRSTPESVNVRSCDQTNLFTIDRQGHNVDGCDAPAKRVKKEFASRHRNASTSSACAHLNCISNVPVKSESSGKDEALNNVVDLAMDSPAKNTQSNDLKDEEVHELDVSSSGTDAVSDTHVIFAIDCSSSMKKVDVYSSRGKISRWTAVFKCVDTFIEQQRQHHNSGAEEKCFISLLIFNNSAKVLMNRIRLDDCARVQAALKKAEREKPIGGTSFSAGFQEVYALSNGSGDKDKVMVVFLSDGRPGDLQSTPPKDSSADMQPTFKCHGKKYPSASHWIEKMMDKSNKQVNFQFICLYDEGKHVSGTKTNKTHTFHYQELTLFLCSSPSGWNTFQADTKEPFTIQIFLSMTTIFQLTRESKSFR